jgi:hypothetical protein
MVQPDRVLPETDPDSFTGLVRRYVEDYDGLGLSSGGSSPNVALQRPVSASASNQAPASLAVDGDHDTHWGAGTGPPAWLEIALDGPTNIAEVSVNVAQSPPGTTVHRLYGRSATGEIMRLHEWRGLTKDGDVLVANPQVPWTNITAVRIETTASPSWVAWREINVIAIDQ